jgi:hypothetical protein
MYDKTKFFAKKLGQKRKSDFLAFWVKNKKKSNFIFAGFPLQKLRFRVSGARRFRIRRPFRDFSSHEITAGG